ncbi:hypothetical protein BN1263260003 [Stenotrophomonas maltophilia]|nr:hypothetical protein BN1263260003 [Stenotrophomonas maltophilia]
MHHLRHHNICTSMNRFDSERIRVTETT